MSRARSWDLRPWRPLLRLLRSGSVQVIHSHMLGSNAWAVVLGRLMRIPVVVTHEHTWEFSGQPMRQLLDKYLIAAGSDILIACSEEDRRRMTEVEKIPPKSTMYLPNGIDGRAPHAGPRHPGRAADPPRRAGRRQRRRHAKAEAPRRAVAGSGAVRAALPRPARPAGRRRQRARQLGGAGRGARARRDGDDARSRGDVRDVLEAFDVATVSSDFEGSPLAVMEYMEAGLPVVSTAVGGLPKMIHVGVHGRLVAPRNPDALAAAIAELLADPERRAEMGAAARERRRAEYDLDVMVSRVEDLYEQLLTAR